MTTPRVMCPYCKHYTENQTCKAFPDGIADDIFMGFVQHDRPVDGDHGIQFEDK